MCYIGIKKLWLCKCDCGSFTKIPVSKLINGHTTSCGCFHKEVVSKTFKTHGKSHCDEYNSWASMIQRCTNVNNPAYHHYGGRGIKICDRWLESFENFLEDMGEKPKDNKKYMIERVNNNGNYEPSNCIWATNKIQSRNRRNNHLLTYNGITKCIDDWAKEYNIPFGILSARINRGKWDIERALLTPIIPNPPQIFIKFNDKQMSVLEFSKIINIPKDVIRARLRHGWTIEEIVNTPYSPRVI